MDTDLTFVREPDLPATTRAKSPQAVAKRRVRVWMVETDRTYATLAAELGVSTSHLQTVMYGLKGCSLALATRWADLSKLSLSTFVDLRKP